MGMACGTMQKGGLAQLPPARSEPSLPARFFCDDASFNEIRPIAGWLTALSGSLDLPLARIQPALPERPLDGWYF